MLTEQKIQIVRTLVEQAPDPVVGRLQAALAQAGGDEVLASVRQLVDLEAEDRRLRNAALATIAPMCVGDGRASDRLIFPSRALGLVWRGLKQHAPRQVSDARALQRDMAGSDETRSIFDELCRLAAAGLREGQGRDYVTAGEAAEAARPNGAELLALCLDLSPVVRQACVRLPDWINRMTDDRIAQVRVAFKDAVAVGADAGPVFFEMLAAQLAHPCQVLRVIAAVMDGPNEHYFAASESAVFAVRLLDRIDVELQRLTAADLAGPVAGREAVANVERIVEQIGELSSACELDREGEWGRRVARQKAGLAQAVEARFKEIDKGLAAALPTRQERVARMVKTAPRLTDPPDQDAVVRAVTLLRFVEDIRPFAANGGFASSRTALVEKVGETINAYVEDLLERMRHDEIENKPLARAFLNVAADCTAVLQGPKAGELIRRRATH